MAGDRLIADESPFGDGSIETMTGAAANPDLHQVPPVGHDQVGSA
jgi:hypothetical protein